MVLSWFKDTNNKLYSSGFTIVELLIVIVVIGILATITVISYNGITNNAKDSAGIANAEQLGKKVTSYALLNAGTLPADKTELASDIGIVDSSNQSYQYTLNTSITPNIFCLTITKDGISTHVAGTSESLHTAVSGPCVSYGHTGTPPNLATLGCPTGFIPVPGNSLFDQKAFCVMKYEAKIMGNNDGTTTYSSSFVPESRPSGTPWVNITQPQALSRAPSACSGCHLITESEWLTIANNVENVASNWSSGTVGSGFIYSGHTSYNPGNPFAASDNDSDGNFGYTGGTGPYANSNNRRTLTLTNGEVIWDFAGNVWEWTDKTTQGANNQLGLPGSGYVWSQWNNTSLLPGSFLTSFPKYGSPSASSLYNGHGIGALYSSTNEAGLRAVRRGGDIGSGYSAGIFALSLSYAPTDFVTVIGFRVAD